MQKSANAIKKSVLGAWNLAGAWKIEVGAWSQKLGPGSWKFESRVPGTFWEIEARAALRGSSKSGPGDPWAQYINRYI